jgi:glycosyltransferase involved in cell wall biosynthesis
LIERKLRIMMLAPTPYFTECGCHVRIYEEARALIRRGHDVRIATYHLGRDMPGIPTWRIPRMPWAGKLSADPSWHKPYLDILLYNRALKLARAFRPHLIHAHLHEGAWIGGRLKKQLRIPLLFDYQGSLTGKMTEHGLLKQGSFLHRYFSRLEQRINSGAADFIITSSGPEARDLIDRWSVAEDKVAPLLDGVDTALFRPYSRDEVRAKLRIPLDMPLVVFLGSLNRSQDIAMLLSAIVQLKSKGFPIRFLIMGFPEEEHRNKAIELGIDRMITFTGRIDYAKAPFYLSAGDLAVSAKLSLTESNGKLLNYMACGLPTVAFDTPVNRELLGDAGVYAEYGDASDLAAKLDLLTHSKDERDRLRLLALERIGQRHSWDIRGKELDEIYRLKLRR